MIVGITGGIASGKSNVTKEIKALGYKVIDADVISKSLTKKNKAGYYAIKEAFGEAFLDENEQIDRAKLGKLIFDNVKEREKLNATLHPLIYQKIVEEIQHSQEKMLFLDVPLLFEAQFDKLCDKIICVYLSFDLQVERLMARDKISKDYAIKKITSQMSLQLKKSMSDYIVDTSGSFAQTKERLMEVINKILGEQTC